MSIKQIAIVAVCALIFATLIYGFINGAQHRDSPLKFDRSAWKQAENSNSNLRLRMVDDLELKLKGLSKTDVQQLLGPPSTDHRPVSGDEYFYLLGRLEHFQDVERTWLHINFGNGRVKDAQVLRD